MRPLDDPAPPDHELLPSGRHLLRVGRWLGRTDVASVVLFPAALAPEPADVVAWLEALGGLGYHRVVTSALGPRDQAPFLAAGFTVRERLHLLSHHLDPVPAAPRRVVLRRMHRADRPEVLALDELAFGPDRRFDGPALADAIAATPFSRPRLAPGDAGVQGYAVSGRSHAHGYLQRLAVHPDARRTGLGAALVVDALRWMRRHGADTALVNTQHGNDAAMALYARLGFERSDVALAVLEAAVPGAPAPAPSMGEDGRW